MTERHELVVVGAGLAGPLLSIYLARRGHRVTVFEMRPDMRREQIAAGRSINLALAERGINALRNAGALDVIEDQLIPMRGRMIHDVDRNQHLQPYGQNPNEVIYSVSRGDLNQRLMTLAENEHGVTFRFMHALRELDPDSGEMEFEDLEGGDRLSVSAERVIATDGGGSIMRRTLAALPGFESSEELLAHGYKELSIPADADGGYLLDANALHIWPRGGFMLIALANPGGSFTVTLFLPREGSPGFSGLTDANLVERFFARHFPDALELIPDLGRAFFDHPVGELGTIRCAPYHHRDRILLLGDAAHAVVPFHGQGMNCAFEDCVVLDRILEETDDNWSEALASFSQQRNPDCNAIADMALENYVEMRDSVNDPGFVLRKRLSFELEKRFPDCFIPRYSMVMFHDEIPYSEAQRRGSIQSGILHELTAGKDTISGVDYALAEKLIRERL